MGGGTRTEAEHIVGWCKIPASTCSIPGSLALYWIRESRECNSIVHWFTLGYLAWEKKKPKPTRKNILFSLSAIQVTFKVFWHHCPLEAQGHSEVTYPAICYSHDTSNRKGVIFLFSCLYNHRRMATISWRRSSAERPPSSCEKRLRDQWKYSLHQMPTDHPGNTRNSEHSELFTLQNDLQRILPKLSWFFHFQSGILCHLILGHFS